MDILLEKKKHMLIILLSINTLLIGQVDTANFQHNVFIINKVMFGPKYIQDNKIKTDSELTSDHSYNFTMNNIPITEDQMYDLNLKFKEIVEQKGTYHYYYDSEEKIRLTTCEFFVINPIEFQDELGNYILKPLKGLPYKVLKIKRNKRLLRRDLIHFTIQYD